MPEQTGSDYLRVGRIAVQRGLLTREQLERCVHLLSEEAYSHLQRDCPIPSLGDILVREGHLTSAMLRDIELEIEKSSVLEPQDHRFGKYRLIREVGRGGMSIVWEAFDTELKRRVALKFLNTSVVSSKFDVEVGEDEVVKRFQREAQTSARMQHPNVVRIYEVGVHEGTHYISMEYLHGRPLHRVILDENPGLRDLVTAVRDAALGVQHAHEHGILHRDLKPQNIMVCDADGSRRVVVMDFGLARDVEDGNRLTLSGIALGTPSYMSPENAQGSKRVIDKRSDVYSLGAVLYEAVTKQPPFDGATPMEIMLKVVNDPLKPPRAWNPKLPPDLEAICLRAMEKEPERRYPDAKSMADDLTRFLEGGLVEAEPPSWIMEFRRVASQRKWIGAAAGALLVLAAAGIVAWKRSSDRIAEVDRLLQRATELELAGDFEKALAEYDAALAVDAGREDVRQARGEAADKAKARTIEERLKEARAFRSTSRFVEAVEAYGRVIELDSEHLEALTERSQCHRALGEDAAALRDLLKLEHRTPESPEVLRDIGHLYAEGKLRNLSLARDYLERAVRLNPKIPDGYHKLGHVLTWAQNDAESERAFVQGTQFEDDLWKGVCRVDLLLVRINRWCDEGHNDEGLLEEIRQEADQHVKEGSELCIPYYVMGRIYHEQGLYSQAIPYLDRACEKKAHVVQASKTLLEKCRNRQGAHFIRLDDRLSTADRLVRERNYAGAVEEYTLILQFHPDHAGAYSRRGHCYDDLGNHKAAKEDFQKAVDLNPDSASYHRDLGMLCHNSHEQRDDDLARKHLMRAVELDSAIPEGYHTLGHVYERAKEWVQASEAYTRAIELDPSRRNECIKDRANINRQRWCAGGHVEPELLDAALRDLNQVIRSTTKIPDAYYVRGQVHHDLGEFEEAIRDYERAIELKHKQSKHIEGLIRNAKQRKGHHFN